MGLFSSSKAWTAHAQQKDPDKKKGSWSEVQEQKRKERKEELEKDRKEKAKQRRILKRWDALKGAPTWSQVQRGANKKALERAAKREAKRKANKAARKASRKAKGFWG